MCARRVRDHHPGGRQGVLEPRQEAERGRGGRAAGHPVPHRPVLHLAAAPRCECCGRAGRGARRAAWGSPPRPQFLLDIARQKNQTPLPLIKPYSGPRLPPDRYCLTAPNYRLKSLQKKVRGRQGGVHSMHTQCIGRGAGLGVFTPQKDGWVEIALNFKLVAFV